MIAVDAAAGAASGRLSVLLVHGAGGGAWEWSVWGAVLQAHGLQAQAIDLQPMTAGLSSTALRHYELQVRVALQRLPHPRVVAGASLGGLLAAMCADQADALVLVNPLPPSPWQNALARRAWDEVVGWRRDARLASTRAAMMDADEASALFSFRHWRDESGKVMGEALAGVDVPIPSCPALFVISSQDEDVPPPIICAWAKAWQASTLETLATSHVGPLLGRDAGRTAREAVAWLNRLDLPR